MYRLAYFTLYLYKHYAIQNHTLFHVSIHTYIHPKHTALAQWVKSPCLWPILCLQKAQTTVLLGMSGIKQCGFFSLLTSSIERCVWGSRGDNCERNNYQSYTIVKHLPAQRYHVYMCAHLCSLASTVGVEHYPIPSHISQRAYALHLRVHILTFNSTQFPSGSGGCWTPLYKIAHL